MKLTVRQLRKIIKESLETTFNDKVKQLQLMPEFESIDNFVASKEAKNDLDYHLYELEALAKNSLTKRMEYLSTKRALDSEKNKIVSELIPKGFRLRNNIN